MTRTSANVISDTTDDVSNMPFDREWTGAVESRSALPNRTSAAPETSCQAAPQAVLMSGLPGAGKTTLARDLAAHGLTRLCPDEEMFRRYGRYGVDFPRGQFRVREAPVLKDTANDLRDVLSAGRDVVLDHGFWTAAERVEWAGIVKKSGGVPLLVYLPVPHAERWSRISQRNEHSHADANSIEFSEEDLLRFEGRFDPPGADEPHLVYDGRVEDVLAALRARRASGSVTAAGDEAREGGSVGP